MLTRRLERGAKRYSTSVPKGIAMKSAGRRSCLSCAAMGGGSGRLHQADKVVVEAEMVEVEPRKTRPNRSLGPWRRSLCPLRISSRKPCPTATCYGGHSGNERRLSAFEASGTVA